MQATTNASPEMSFKEKAYLCIKEDIISCKLLPGSVLSEKELVVQLGISRTPIREALNRLEQEGLVKIVPQRGVFVSNVTLKMTLELYQVREVLEPFIVRLATPLVSEEKMGEFRSGFAAITEATSKEDLIALDHQFHYYLAEVCGNGFLAQLTENIRAQINRSRLLSCRDYESLIKGREEHLAIIDALLERDVEKAAAAMYQHLVRSRQSAF
ncbi:MAG: GntR family transcriptional regulator [Negativicutes bacterium]|nr:GntR family transcriptional regulator [Negativicutes bacterium]